MDGGEGVWSLAGHVPERVVSPLEHPPVSTHAAVGR